MKIPVRAPGEQALFRTVSARGVEAVTHDVADLGTGFHAVVMTFDGELSAVRFHDVEFHENTPWAGVLQRDDGASQPSVDGVVTPADVPDASDAWSSSLSREAYEDAVRTVRERIAAGTAYQVNVCRVLTRDGAGVDMDGLFRDVLAQNPAPYACRIDVAGELDVVSASPELFLRLEDGEITSAPIKGTAVTADTMLAKDVSENVMITDLVRNDLQRVCVPGTVVVDPLLETQPHPGLVHLVSTVGGRLAAGITWVDVVEACSPPGSVSGAPKSSALEIIDELEPVSRGPYCGAIGWIDADSGRAELAVGIRTFWREAGRNDSTGSPIFSQTLSFGTGAGITWDSDPAGEWDETQLKARRLVALVERHLPRE